MSIFSWKWLEGRLSRMMRKYIRSLKEQTAIHSAVPPLGICPKDLTFYFMNTFPTMFKISLLTISRTLKQFKCFFLIIEWVMTMWDVYTISLQRKWNHHICRWIAGFRWDYVAWNKAVYERQTLYIPPHLQLLTSNPKCEVQHGTGKA